MVPKKSFSKFWDINISNLYFWKVGIKTSNENETNGQEDIPEGLILPRIISDMTLTKFMKSL